MPILSNVEIWFAKVDPKHPSTKFNKKNPTWECQIRTTDKAQKKEWEEMHLAVKAMIPDEGEPYYRVNLKKKSIKEDGEPSSFVDVVDGDLNPVNPTSIGNGSIGNVRIYQYDYTNSENGKPGVASILMGIQLTKHIVYVPKPRDDDFTETTTEVIAPTAEENEEEPVGDNFVKEGGKPKVSTPKAPSTPKSSDEEVY